MKLALEIILLVFSVILILLVLMHKGQGGGLSDMFGGGMNSNISSSGVAEKNLNRITIIVAILWIIVIFALGIIGKS